MSIGFSLYMDMFDKVVNVFKEGWEFLLDDVILGYIEVELCILVLLFEDYIVDVNICLLLYKCLVSCML